MNIFDLNANEKEEVIWKRVTAGAFQNVAKVANLQQFPFSLKHLFQRLATFNPVRHFEMHPLQRANKYLHFLFYSGFCFLIEKTNARHHWFANQTVLFLLIFTNRS